MEKVKNIILDYGNVIYMIDFNRSQAAFNQLGIKDADHIFAHHGQIALFDEFDKGNISEAAFRQGIRDLTGNATLSDEQIDAAWNALLIGVPSGKYELLEQLNKNYRLFLLSNNNAIHYKYCMNDIFEQYGIESNEPFFEKTYYSHLVGMRKPDAAIFEFIAQDASINPSETLFIDDSPQHLETAKTLGFQVELCTPQRPLEQIVYDLNLL